MCILTFYRPGITPDLDALAAGAFANPDGHGYALVADDRILVGHGLDPREVITEFVSARAAFPDSFALFHSRLATHGTVTTDNCHPFYVGGDKRTVLAHNGILPKNVQPAKDDPRSDTRIAAEDFLPRQPFGSLDSWAGRDGLERWMGSDKMVLLTVDPDYKHTAYLFNEHFGHYSPDGVWYSNTSYRWASNSLAWWDDDDPYCGMCGDELDPRQVGSHCTFCGYCQSCFRRFPHCSCPNLDGQTRYADLDILAERSA
ncbi:class II glutamine amidotransferase [Nocardia sp. NPDC003482]